MPIECQLNMKRKEKLRNFPGLQHNGFGNRKASSQEF